MAHVYLGIGSNVDRERHIAMGLLALRGAFGELRVSKVYRCRAVGFDGDDFYNLAVGLTTDLDPLALRARLQEIEDRFGRDRDQPRFSDRALDIDILLFDDQHFDQDGLRIPREDVLREAYVLKPLTDLAPDLQHPDTGRTLNEHWRAMAAERAPDPGDLVEVPMMGLD